MRCTSLSSAWALLVMGALAPKATVGLEVDRFTVDGGGGTSSGGEFALSGTIGQPDATSTVMTGGEFELEGGFWPGLGEQTMYALTLYYINQQFGRVLLDPPPDDPNLPLYPAGTEVILTAEPNEGKGFKWWTLYDPNHPGDGNYGITDTNNPIALVMDSDWEVEAKFKCGAGSALPFLPVILGVLGLAVWVRRRA